MSRTRFQGLRRRVVAGLVAASMAASSAGALAQSPPDPAAAARELAAAKAAEKKLDWLEARKRYEASQAAKKSGAAMFGVAEALYQLKRAVEALDAFEGLLKDKDPAAKLTPAQQKAAEARLAELAKSVGTVTVTVGEPGANVQVDERDLGASPVAPVRVAAGPHTVRVTKEGFVPFSTSVDVVGGQTAAVEVQLQRPTQTAEVVITERDGKPLRVRIDGVDVGPTPLTTPLAPGSYQIAGQGPDVFAPAQTVTVTRGARVEVKLVAQERKSKLKIETSDGLGEITLDGKPVGDGAYEGVVVPGAHEIRVTRAGFVPFAKRVDLAEGETRVETVTLERSGKDKLASADVPPAQRPFLGVYGGLSLAGLAAPGGSGSSFEDSCDSLGATSCEGATPLGGMLSGYVGIGLDPFGLEVFAFGSADVQSPSASFDGVTGTDINPTVAKPERTESFGVLRAGGGGGLRARFSQPVGDHFRFGAAVGLGLAYRALKMKRDTTTPDGGEGTFSPPTIKYLTPGLSLDLGGQVLFGQSSTAFTFGVTTWLENATLFDSTAGRTEIPSEPQFVRADSGNRVQATPAYDLARGWQFFVGPFLGVQFGP